MSARAVEVLRQALGPDVLESSDHLGDASVTVRPSAARRALQLCKDRPELDCHMLLDVVGVDYPQREQRFDVIYNLRSLTTRERVRVKAQVGEGEALPTVSDLWYSANWAEREVYDLFGVPFSGHPNLKRILCHHEFEGHALRKDYPIERGQMCYTPEKLLSDEEIQHGPRIHPPTSGRWSEAVSGTAVQEEIQSDYLTVNLGPSHPAFHGALRLEALLDGETIIHSEAEIGYLHRCFEKESEDHTWQQIIPYTDRLNYVSSLTNNVGYVQAVEKMMGIEVPPRCQTIRIIVGEMGRIMDHLVCVGTNLVDIGALTNFWYFFNAREHLYTVIERLCGERLTTSYTRIGGLYRDLYEGFEAELREALLEIEQAIEDVTTLVQRNRIFMDRAVGIGAISRRDALNWGFTGPCLRASGVAYDIRKEFPYLGYQDYDFDVPVGENGDVYDRVLVRIEEMHQSIGIVRQALERLPAGPINSDDRRVALPPKDEVYNSIEGMMNHFKLVFEGIHVPPGEGYGFTEAANGELGFFIVSDGSGRPYRIKVRPPCFPIFSAFPKIIQGHMVADAIAILGGLNVVAGELDR